jgi:hypothetical protein
MTTKSDRSLGLTIPKIRPSAVAKAIARSKAASAAYDAAQAAGEDTSAAFETDEKLYEKLVVTPCASDAEFIEKLRYLLKYETDLFGSPLDSRAEF